MSYPGRLFSFQLFVYLAQSNALLVFGLISSAKFNKRLSGLCDMASGQRKLSIEVDYARLAYELCSIVVSCVACECDATVEDERGRKGIYVVLVWHCLHRDLKRIGKQDLVAM